MRVLPFLVAVVLLCACGSDEEPPRPECETDQDCIEGFECNDGTCKEIPHEEPVCIDRDRDGYGVGESLEDRLACEECENFGRCDEDCDDTDPEIFPGSGARCP